MGRHSDDGRPAPRAALYCRVSTRDQSCERQERDLAAFAERAGFEVVGVFKETGSGARGDWRERARVMALAQAREIDAVLVTELSRWGRSTVDPARPPSRRCTPGASRSSPSTGWPSTWPRRRAA